MKKATDIELSPTLIQFLQMRGHVPKEEEFILNRRDILKIFPDLVFYIHKMEEAVVKMSREIYKLKMEENKTENEE